MYPHRPVAALRELRRTIVAVLAAITTVAVAPLGVAHAATEVDSTSYRSYAVEGYSHYSDECVISVTYVSASEDAIGVNIDSFDHCTGESRFDAGSATPTVFKVYGNPPRVRVVADVLLQESGEVLHLDNTWTATAKPRIPWETIEFEVPDEFRLRQKQKVAAMSATATGTHPMSNTLDTVIYFSKGHSLSVTRS